MTYEQKAMLRQTTAMLSGFCTEDAPETFLNEIFGAVLEGDETRAIALAEEATRWVKQWEKEVYDEVNEEEYDQ
jgi:hypothetical protein